VSITITVTTHKHFSTTTTTTIYFKQMPSKCRLMPHGSYTLWIATLSTIAWCASLFQDGCDYAKVTGTIVSELASRPDVPYLEFGLGAYREPYPVAYSIAVGGGGGATATTEGSQHTEWAVNYSGECTEYPFELDGYWKVSKAAAFLALVIGGGGTLFVWCSTCFVFSKGTWKWAGYELLVAASCQVLAFLWFRTGSCTLLGSTCVLFWGSKANIIATVCWMVAGICIVVRYPTPIEEKLLQHDEAQDQVGGSGESALEEEEMDSAGHASSLTTISSGTLSNGGGPMIKASTGLGSRGGDDDGEPIHPNAEVI
jgi:hypothetical protein